DRVEDRHDDDQQDDQHEQQRRAVLETTGGEPVADATHGAVVAGIGLRPGGRLDGGHARLLARSRMRSVPTAMTMKMPTKRKPSWVGQPSWVTPETTVCTRIAPSRVPTTLPRPPMIEVPPMTTAAMTCSSLP